jgi:hypothetical protein
MRPLLVVGAALPLSLGLALVPALASATARALPFTYNYETNAEGEGEIETYIDLVPVKGVTNAGNTQTVLLSQFQEEFEYGITNRLELGLYVTFAPPPSGFAQNGSVPSLTEANGSKQRLRYRLFDEGVLPVDIGLYGEVTENENEIELEAKVILQKRVGHLAIAANLVTEREFYFTGQADQILDPSAGFWFQVTPVFQPGFEWWMYKEWTNQAPPGGAFNLDLQQYAGPTVLLNLGRVWWTTGAYARLTEVGHVMTPGVDAFGQLWFRTVIGVNL